MSSITIVSVTPQYEASHTDDSRVIIYGCNMFIIQAATYIQLLLAWNDRKGVILGKLTRSVKLANCFGLLLRGEEQLGPAPNGAQAKQWTNLS